MASEQAQARRQQKVEELCAAAIRALSGRPDLHFRGRRLHRGSYRLPAFAPHLHPSIEEDDFGSFRGAADGLALRVALSDADLHRRLSPDDPAARLLFELLEQIRVESQAPADMAGVRTNLHYRFAQWSLAFERSRLTETARGILIYALAQVCRSRVLGEPIEEHSEELIETTRGKLVPIIGQDLAALRRHRADQAAYGRHARAIADQVAGMLRDLDETDQEEKSEGDEEEETDSARFSLALDLDGGEDRSIVVATTQRSVVLDAAEEGYRVFTRAYDREERAEALVRAALLREYRERLDTLVAAQGINVARLALQLKLLLADPTRDGWDGAQEEGYVDGRRLAQLVSAPFERRLFRHERIERLADAVVGILIDCSGSMKQNVERVAVLVDVLARALELAGVANEVLGFTTGAWNGGRAARDWQRAGRPPHPGRLNEVSHMVFKDADTPWRRARPGLAALLKTDLFRESVDGEAIDWACERLQQRAEAHRLLIVISDGCPMDSATQLANDATYLDQHLQQVIERHERAGLVQVYGVGVGLDLSVFYDHCQAIDLTQTLRNQVFREIVDLLGSRRKR